MSPCVTHNTVRIQTLALSEIGRIGVIRASPLSLSSDTVESKLPLISLLQGSPNKTQTIQTMVVSHSHQCRHLLLSCLLLISLLIR